jgi:hypothetical protein
MLTAATAALLSSPVYAQLVISTKVTDPQSTSVDGPITITTTGSIVITTNPETQPALTINGGIGGGPADVFNQGTISYVGVGDGTNALTGIEIDDGLTGTGGTDTTGGLDNAGKIDFTGAGSNKTGILIANPTAGTAGFVGDIGCTGGGILTGSTCSTGTPVSQLVGVQDSNLAAILLESGSSLKVQGDSSYGIDIPQGSILGDVCTGCASDIDIAGILAMTPTSSGSTTSSANALYLAGTMYGDINLIEGGEITVQGASSYGINIIAPDSGTGAPGGILNGNISIDGSLLMTPINTTSQTYGNNIAIDIAGTVNGYIDIEKNGAVSATGFNAQGIVLTGTLNGYLENQGILDTAGTASPLTKGGNPEGGSALIVQGSINPTSGNGGIFNAGPADPADTTASATIATTGAVPTITISPNSTTQASIIIGTYTDVNGDAASILNRGVILNNNENPDPSVAATALSITGDSSTVTTSLPGGIFNAGTIEASASTDSNALTGSTAITILIGPYAYIGGNGIGLTNSNENTNRPGQIIASSGGAAGGQAIAIEILANGSLPIINNYGTISATAGTTNTNLANSAVSAYAIDDFSGSLTTINNFTGGVISATASILKDNSQIAVAANLVDEKANVTFTNNGTVTGDIDFGSFNDVLNVTGFASNEPATVTGNLFFGGNNGADDQLVIGQWGTVTGQVYAGSFSDRTAGQLDVSVGNEGNLNMLTAATNNGFGDVHQSPPAENPLIAGSFDVASGGSVDIHYAQAFMQQLQGPAIIKAMNEVTLADGANVTFTADSFISPPTGQSVATFVVFDSFGAPLNISANELNNVIMPTFIANLSFLYDPTVSGLTLADNNQELLLTIAPKTIGADGCTIPNGTGCNPAHIPLNGFAAKLFPYVNVALGNDNGLGSAMIQGIKNSYDAQNAYTEFAPDVSGATRALAISLTDDATSVVAARQKALREYANQDGDLTLWGQQFVQRLSQDFTIAGPGYRDTGFGFVVGADEGDPVDGRYGAAFTFFSGGERGQDPALTKTSSDWYLLTGYTDWRGKGLFLDTDATVGYVSLMGNRYLNLQIPNGNQGFTSYSRDAMSQHAGEFLSGGVTSGVVFDESGTVITPQISLNGMAMRQEQYTETGGGNGYDLHVASAYDQSLRGFVGVGLRQDFDFTDFLLQPNLTAGYRYDFANGAESLKANFISVSPPSIFEITGPKPDKGNAVVGGGLAVSTGAWSLGFDFDYLKAGSGNTAEQGSITLLGRI